MATTVQVKIDPTKLATLLRSPSGDLARHTIVVGQAVVDGAKSRVGVSADVGDKPGPHLRDAIVKRLDQRSQGLAVVLQANVPHAEFHHEGTKPHEIRPKKAKVLVFNVGGKTIFTTRVKHPGTKPNRFFTDAALALGLRVKDGGGGI